MPKVLCLTTVSIIKLIKSLIFYFICSIRLLTRGETPKWNFHHVFTYTSIISVRLSSFLRPEFPKSGEKLSFSYWLLTIMEKSKLFKKFL